MFLSFLIIEAVNNIFYISFLLFLFWLKSQDSSVPDISYMKYKDGTMVNYWGSFMTLGLYRRVIIIKLLNCYNKVALIAGRELHTSPSSSQVPTRELFGKWPSQKPNRNWVCVQWNLSIVNSHGTQNNVHYTGVFTQEGWDMFMHTCARNTMYTCILKPTSQIYLIFDSWISLNFFPASSSSFVLLTCLQRQTRCAHCDCNLQTDWHLAISLKHCSHYWETNKTLSTWYSVKFMGIWDHWPLWTFTRPGVKISQHLPVSIQSLVVELSW